MIKNTAGQVVAFQMISVTDGSDVTTGTPTVYITGDGGVQATGTGTIAHEGMGQWTYAPVQSETNYNHAAYTMVLAGAVSQTVNVYPVVLTDYKADVSALATDAALTAHDTSIDTQLANIPTIAEFNARTIPAADYVVVTDTIAGVTDVTNLHASAATATNQTNIDGKINTIDTVVDAIKLETDKISGASAGADGDTITVNSLAEILRRLRWLLQNKMDVTNANGNTIIKKDDNITDAFNVLGALTDDSTTTTRLRL